MVEAGLLGCVANRLILGIPPSGIGFQRFQPVAAIRCLSTYFTRESETPAAP